MDLLSLYIVPKFSNIVIYAVSSTTSKEHISFEGNISKFVLFFYLIFDERNFH